MNVDGKDIIFCKADLSSEEDSVHIVPLLNEYATHTMGGEEELSHFVKENLVAELRRRPFCHVFFAKTVADSRPIAMALCFEGFSSFACKPLLNVHDLIVTSEYRGKHLGRNLLLFLSEYAKRELDCCKVTLEVIEGNHVAQKTYLAAGFEPYTLSESTGKAMFWAKSL